MTFQLNPHIETLFLLVSPNWGKAQKKEAIAKLDELGLNGIAFYKAHFPLIERYYAAFSSQMIKTQGSTLIAEMCEELIYLLTAILLQHPQWLNDFNVIPEADALAVIKSGIIDLLEAEGETNLIDALESSGLSDQAKWQMSALLQQPRQRLTAVFDAIQANLTAFEYAYLRIEREIDSLLTQLAEYLNRDDLPPIMQPLNLNLNAVIIPSMAVALGLIVIDEFCIYGLMTNRLFAGDSEDLTRAEAILVAKSLSDASKLDILLALKNNSLYNLEIARALGLTPATTSHHMSMLLAASLVEVSKRDGKVYYSLSTDGIKRYRDWLDTSLL